MLIRFEPLPVVVEGDIGEIRANRRPVHSAEEHRFAVDDTYPRVGFRWRAFTRLPFDVLESDTAFDSVVLGVIRSDERQRQVVKCRLAKAVRLPRLDIEVRPQHDVLARCQLVAFRSHRIKRHTKPPTRFVRRIDTYAEDSRLSSDVKIRTDGNVTKLADIGNLKAHLVPDADLHEPRDPVPRVVVPWFELGHPRGIAKLPEPPWWTVEDDFEPRIVSDVRDVFREIEDVWRVGARECGNLPSTESYPATVIQSIADESNAHTVGRSSEPLARDTCHVHPMPVFDPLARACVQPLIPIGQQTLLE